MLLASIGFRVQPHKRAEVLSAVDETVRRTATTSAASRLLADADDPNVFMVLSEWQSADTADVFFNSRDFQIFKGIRILLRDEPVIVFDEVRIARPAGCCARRRQGRLSAAARFPASSSGCAACSASSRAPARRRRCPRSATARRSARGRCAAVRSRSASRSPARVDALHRRDARVHRRERRAGRQDDRALQHVLQLADVARPVVRFERRITSAGMLSMRSVQRRGQAVDEMLARAAGCPRDARAATAA